jgi:hypothetical protein
MSDATTIDGTVFARWRADPAAFVECLIDPDTGEPILLLPIERVFLKHMFETNSAGRLLYPDLIYEAPRHRRRQARQPSALSSS